MDWQWIANGLFTLSGVLLGILYSNLRSDLKKHEELMTSLTKDVHELDKVVAGDYVKREELKDLMKDIKSDLEKIYQKLEGKANKHERI